MIINYKLNKNIKLGWCLIGSEILNNFEKNKNFYNNFLNLNGKDNVNPVFWEKWY